MNEKLKQRLVGAVVLVSLAVIFLPMMLDGGERSSMPMFGSNIPEKPDYRFEPLDIPLQPVTSVSDERPLLVDKPETAPKPASGTDEKPKETDAPVSQESASLTPTPSGAGSGDTPADPVPSTTTPDSGQSAWVVQVGSFSQSTNALALRDKLRKKGFSAFVEKLKADGNMIYRVRIGPELRRENAEKQQQRMQRVMGMKGIVMEHN